MQEVLVLLKAINLEINILGEHNLGISEHLIHVDLQEI
jgi:hypothetical protein